MNQKEPPFFITIIKKKPISTLNKQIHINGFKSYFIFFFGRLRQDDCDFRANTDTVMCFKHLFTYVNNLIIYPWVQGTMCNDQKKKKVGNEVNTNARLC